MIFASGRISASSPTCGKLLGILSMKRGAPLRRCMLRAAEVVLAERQKVLGSELTHRFGVVDAVDPVAIEPARHAAQVGQLARALDLAVAREDLLEQRRPRARQPEDEDRRRIREDRFPRVTARKSRSNTRTRRSFIDSVCTGS